ncbi:hypothetical protein Y032_0476g2140 [Ancylostoma ceylanicum]|uniref:Uncharacterized protein n=1 Tax=Ancylostoma ceylanicum TaxID=53326 RepID=A0A016WWH2_9BILA|nr:hypothetical protein Y032_0476g2140 [Ancylostoma ceylanicum]
MIRALNLPHEQIPGSRARNKNFRLSPLCQRRKKNDLLFFHKIIYGETSLKLTRLVSVRTSTTRGGTTKFLIPKPKLCCRRFSFIHRVIPDFEKLKKTRTISFSYNAFKKVLNSCLDP